jgi:hypothetical protein
MSTFEQVQTAVAMFSPEQLADLELFVRQKRLEKSRERGQSVLDLPPLDLGCQLAPLGDRNTWHDEMLGARE